jgi:enterochelin esterase-like enzyme
MLHGLGNTSTEWTQRARAPQIVDNLLADGKVQPMIMIFPNGDAKFEFRTFYVGSAGLDRLLSRQLVCLIGLDCSRNRPRPAASNRRG